MNQDRPPREWYNHPIFIFMGRAIILLAAWIANEIRWEISAMREAQIAQVQALQQTQESMANIARDLALKTASRWTQIDQRVWATILAQRNPRIIVPEPVHQELPGEDKHP